MMSNRQSFVGRGGEAFSLGSGYVVRGGEVSGTWSRGGVSSKHKLNTNSNRLQTQPSKIYSSNINEISLQKGQLNAGNKKQGTFDVLNENFLLKLK
ncbi:unnamed protein product [Brachionus calyciflorus]|uniref:Uncharacterized protein n=1 Tax=Brachionus calyciflorus TaxID=104777 RepID=A0A813M3P7_9BILA|nr:unnamed protein product [Brachionus calyciflorus]